MDTPRTLQEAIVYFADFEHCRQFLMSLRWPDGKVACPTCGSERVIWMARVRRWKCYEKHVVPQFSLKTGSIFEDSPLGLDKWLAALWLLVNCKNGISSCEIARDLGITQKSAWFMAHRLRFALHHGSFDKLSGELEADETNVGGKARNMSKAHRAKKGISQHRSMAGKVAVNYWSLLKRALKGTYVSVEPFHLFRYLDEQAYRFNNRKDASDFDRFRMATEMIVGRRFTWKQLVGKLPDGAAWAN